MVMNYSIRTAGRKCGILTMKMSGGYSNVILRLHRSNKEEYKMKNILLTKNLVDFLKLNDFIVEKKTKVK